MTKRLVIKIIKMPSLFLVFLINIYQKTLSPDHGPIFSKLFPYGYCKYHPTCSEYSKKSLMKYGFFRGIVLSFYRVIRCNPWSKGGVDELR